MSTLQSQRVADLLDKLFADAEKNNPPRLARVRLEGAGLVSSMGSLG